MKFKIEIECGNAAFGEEPLAEVARILEEEAKKMRHWVGDCSHEWDNTLHDENGNRVGTAKMVGKP